VPRHRRRREPENAGTRAEKAAARWDKPAQRPDLDDGGGGGGGRPPDGGAGLLPEPERDEPPACPAPAALRAADLAALAAAPSQAASARGPAPLDRPDPEIAVSSVDAALRDPAFGRVGFCIILPIRGVICIGGPDGGGGVGAASGVALVRAGLFAGRVLRHGAGARARCLRRSAIGFLALCRSHRRLFRRLGRHAEGVKGRSAVAAFSAQAPHQSMTFRGVSVPTVATAVAPLRL
jgi:hypothetical protein